MGEIKEDVRHLREIRKKQAEQKLIDEKLKYEKGRAQLRRMHEQFKREREGSGAPPSDFQTNQPMKQKRASAAMKPTRLTQEMLAALSYKDLNRNQEDDFRPEDLIFDDNNSEDEILQRYQEKEQRSKLAQNEYTIGNESAGTYEGNSARGHVKVKQTTDKRKERRTIEAQPKYAPPAVSEFPVKGKQSVPPGYPYHAQNQSVDK